MQSATSLLETFPGVKPPVAGRSVCQTVGSLIIIILKRVVPTWRFSVGFSTSFSFFSFWAMMGDEYTVRVYTLHAIAYDFL